MLLPSKYNKLQPMDQGIIQATKTKYHNLQIQKMVAAMDKDKLIVGSNLRHQCAPSYLLDPESMGWCKGRNDPKMFQEICFCRMDCGRKWVNVFFKLTVLPVCYNNEINSCFMANIRQFCNFSFKSLFYFIQKNLFSSLISHIFTSWIKEKLWE